MILFPQKGHGISNLVEIWSWFGLLKGGQSIGLTVKKVAYVDYPSYRWRSLSNNNKMVVPISVRALPCLSD